MQIVIEIDKDDYENVCHYPGCYNFGNEIKNGIPLPKGHGRLVDADAVTEKYGEYYTEEGTDEGFIGCLKNLIANAPTIIEADREGEENKTSKRTGWREVLK